MIYRKTKNNLGHFSNPFFFKEILKKKKKNFSKQNLKSSIYFMSNRNGEFLKFKELFKDYNKF